jgi:murein DD-endopeptidase MepM/ murein hydrolase activator NlpD
MKKISLVLLIALSFSLLAGYRSVKPQKFICPIKYEGEIVIRCDGRGDGFFAAERRGGRLHNGVDFYAKVGTPVLSSRSGRVIAAKRNRGMGKYVIIRHWSGYTTVYGHLDKIYVKKNQRVSRGRVIGTVGKTGNARYRDILPHVHFEIKRKGIPQDPLDYIIGRSEDRSKNIKVSLQE